MDARSQARHVLPPESAAFFQHLLPGSELARTADIRIDRDHAVFSFRESGATARIDLRHASTCDHPAGSLCVEVLAADGPGGERLAATARGLLEQAGRASTSSPWVDLQVAPTFWVPAGSCFLVLVLAGALAALWRVRRRFASREAVLPAALFVVALAVRFAARPFPADIRDVLGMLGETRRAGWACYLHLVFSLWPARYETIWNLHRVLGASSVPLLYCVMRSRASARAATAAAALAAVLPLSARFAASDTPFVPLVSAFLGAVVALDAFARTQSRWALALGLALVTCAVQLRPEGPWLVVPAAILWWGHRMPRRSVLRPSVVALVVAFVVLNAPFSIWALSAAYDRGVVRTYLGDFVGVGAVYGSPWLDFAQSPWPATVLVLAGAVVAALGTRAQCLLLVATLVAFPLREDAWGELAHTRYHLPSLHLACGLAGLAVAAALEWVHRAVRSPVSTPVLTALAVIVPGSSMLPRLDFLRRTWTPELEFEQFRAGVRALPADCTIVTLLECRDAGFVPFTDPGAATIVDLGDLAHTDAACLVYYRAANCVAPEAAVRDGSPFHERGGCRRFEDSVRLTPISEAWLPNAPYRGETYDSDPIGVGLFRVDSRQARGP